MKKSSVIILFSAAMLMAAAAGLIFYNAVMSPSPVRQAPSEEAPLSSFSEALYAEFKAAREKNDYTAMNSLYEKNFRETGVSFPEENYDPTHGGKLYTYPYSVKVNGKDETGSLFIISPEVDKDALTAGEADYIALDRRGANDPEFVVYDSYRADSEILIKELCRLLLAHEEAYPTNWSRTLDSLVEEWEIHNAAYSMDYRPESSKDVNLNNADENTDWLKRASKELADRLGGGRVPPSDAPSESGSFA